MTRPRLNGAIGVGVGVALLALVGCAGPEASGVGTSVTRTPANPSRIVTASWTCPETPGDSSWPASKHTVVGKMVPPGPKMAVECTYRKDVDAPFTRFEKPITYTGLALADLVHSFNTAVTPTYGMSCPGPVGVEYMSKINFIYDDGGSAIVSRTGYCPPLISNGTLTQQVTASPSTPAPSP